MRLREKTGDGATWATWEHHNTRSLNGDSTLPLQVRPRMRLSNACTLVPMTSTGCRDYVFILPHMSLFPCQAPVVETMYVFYRICHCFTRRAAVPWCMGVWVCMYVGMHVCGHAVCWCVGVAIFVCMHIHVSMCVCVYVGVHVGMGVGIFICMHIHVSMYVCVCVRVCMHVHVCMHTCICMCVRR